MGGGMGQNGRDGDLENGGGSTDIPEAEDMLTVQRRIAEAERMKTEGDDTSVIRTSFFDTASRLPYNADHATNHSRKISIWQRFFGCNQNTNHHTVTTSTNSQNNLPNSANSTTFKEVLVKPSVHP